MRTPSFACILVGALFVAACKQDAPAPAPPATASEASSTTVRWVAARAAEGTSLLEAPAHVIASPAGRAVISAPLRARIVDVKVQPGAAVVKGTVVVDVLLPEAASAAGAYLAAVDEITAYEQRLTQLEALRKEGLGRQSDIAAVQLELAKLRGARDTAAATLRSANLDLGSARALLRSGGRASLRAPIDGTVTAVTAVVGASEPPEEPLVEIAAEGATRIEARLPRPLPPDARIEFVAIGAAPIAATFVSRAPSREADGTTKAWFELATSAPAGASGRIRATLPSNAGVLVPVTAVEGDGTAATVYRRADTGPVRTSVRVLASSGGDALVEGLAVGDHVAAVATQVASSSASAAPSGSAAPVPAGSAGTGAP